MVSFFSSSEIVSAEVEFDLLAAPQGAARPLIDDLHGAGLDQALSASTIATYLGCWRIDAVAEQLLQIGDCLARFQRRVPQALAEGILVVAALLPLFLEL